MEMEWAVAASEEGRTDYAEARAGQRAGGPASAGVISSFPARSPSPLSFHHKDDSLIGQNCLLAGGSALCGRRSVAGPLPPLQLQDDLPADRLREMHDAVNGRNVSPLDIPMTVAPCRKRGRARREGRGLRENNSEGRKEEGRGEIKFLGRRSLARKSRLLTRWTRSDRLIWSPRGEGRAAVY